jgi:hypothetical protein
MDGTTNGTAAGHDRLGRFVAGHSEYAAKRRRIAAKVKQLAADYDASTPAQKLMLRLAAQSIDAASVTRSSTTRERSSHVALRLLSEIPKRKRQRQSQVLSIEEIDAIGRRGAA